MNKIIQPEWLINGEPREVQLEALRRSYYGYSLRQSRDGEEIHEALRGTNCPAQGWGHLMEMRLGKTPTILNEAALFKRDFSYNKMVVFSPNAYKEDWAIEADKYGLPFHTIAYDQSRLGKTREAIKGLKAGVALIVNYEALIYDQTLDFLDEFVDKYTYMASDESIKLKNPGGLFFKGAIRVGQKAGVKRIATGLPMTQGPMDFYSQARFIGMYNGYTQYAYRGKFCKMGGFKSKKIVGVKNEDVLKSHIESNAFVAKRKDWGNQTPASFYTLKCKLEDVQKKLYTEIDDEFITWLDDGTEISADQVMSKMMKMQQISSGFVYDEDGNAREIIDPRKTPKMLRLREFISEELVGKIIIPYHYAKSGDMLLEVFSDLNPATIRGDNWMRKNGRDVVSEKARFNQDPNCRAIITQISATKYGHDLSGIESDRCTTMAFFENTYSLDDRTQIEARNTTAFQTWENLYFDLVSSPVEQKAIKALADKEDVINAVLGAYREDKNRKVLS